MNDELEMLCKICVNEVNNGISVASIIKILHREKIFTITDLWNAGPSNVQKFKGIGKLRWLVLFTMFREIRTLRRMWL